LAPDGIGKLFFITGYGINQINQDKSNIIWTTQTQICAHTIPNVNIKKSNVTELIVISVQWYTSDLISIHLLYV
jgi:hypothetical protein